MSNFDEFGGFIIFIYRYSSAGIIYFSVIRWKISVLVTIFFEVKDFIVMIDIVIYSDLKILL